MVLREKIVITVPELQKIYPLSKPSLYAAIKRGELPSIKHGRRILIPVAALEKYLSSVGINA